MRSLYDSLLIVRKVTAPSPTYKPALAPEKKHFVSDIQSLTIFSQFFTQKCIGELEISIKFCLFYPNTGF
jgi:hypothetical protein